MDFFRIISKRQQIQTVAERFAQQYSNYDPNTLIGGAKRRPIKETLAKLRALDLTSTTPEEVEAILPGWIELRCDCCQQDKDFVLQMGEEPYYEARWLDLCLDCLEQGHVKLSQAHA